MSDVRTLLKAKRQEIRIDHPLASYTSSGQLRCTVCGIAIKHPSAWDGHLGSKAHRTNAARIRDEERKQKERELDEETQRFKRKIPEDDIIDADVRSAMKKPRVVSAPQSSTSSFPSDFFSDPSKAPLLTSNVSEDEDETAEMITNGTTKVGREDSLLEQEWIQFQQSVVDAPDVAPTYDRATIVAEPELVTDLSEGFPSHDIDGAQALASSKVDEDERRRRKDREERELIMDRLMEEERAQEEADMKVAIMKNRLEALRKRREASRNTKPNVAIP